MANIKELVNKIDLYDNAYYNESKSLVSDQEYDGLKDQLRSLSVSYITKESKNKDEILLAERINDALTRVGAPPPSDGKWSKYQHEVSMGSLNKVNTPEEFDEWHKKCGSPKTLLETEKLDGMSISLKYEHDNLVCGSTRGNGDIGENITRNIGLMFDVPTKLKEDFSGHIRGEIVLLRSIWKKHLSDMANPRNAANGMAKRIDGEGCNYLTIIAYTIEGKDFKLESEAYEYIKKLGFKIPNYRVGTVEDGKVLWKEYMDEKREKLDYDIDGLVFVVNDRAARFALGEEAHRPKGAIAFKFEAPAAGTKVNDIIDQVGDSGQITPVAEFDEVELLGVKITRASLHNYSLVKQLGINIGAEVLVTRANDVIPEIIKVTKPNNGYYHAPEKCPECGAKTIRVGEYVKCPNKSTCPAQVIGRLNKWIGELGILEWGESILTKLIAAGKVTDIADLYKLKAADITNLERMGDKGAANLLNELDKYRAVTLENFVGGLSIDGVATSTVKSVIDKGHDTLDKLRALSQKQLENIPGFGEKRAQALHDGLIENKDRMQDILNAGVTIKAKPKGSLTGMKIAITGTLSTPRKQIQNMIVDAGGEVDKSVGKGTTHLLIDDTSSTSSKAQAARKLGTVLLSESDFLAMVK